jgi:hypothetical protein
MTRRGLLIAAWVIFALAVLIGTAALVHTISTATPPAGTPCGTG